MKKIMNETRTILLIACLCTACGTEPARDDKEFVILYDQSDPLKVTPQFDEICTQLGLKQDAWQGIRVKITTVTDKDINKVQLFTLAKADRLYGNSTMRNAEVERFKQKLRKALQEIPASGTLEHSIIYRAMAKHLNLLARSTATRKQVIIYSDLYENSDVSFYDPATFQLLQAHPEAIRRKLEKTVVLGKLSGIQVWLMYDPESYEANNNYMTIANFYKRWLESKGATVRIENTLNL